MRLSNTNLGKILFKYFRGTLKDKPKDEVNNYVFDIIIFISKERITNESLYIKCNKKNNLIIVLKHNLLLYNAHDNNLLFHLLIYVFYHHNMIN